MSQYLQLAHLTGLRIDGPDAVAFSQSQLTTDVEALPLGQWQATAWCSPKGRVLIVLLIVRHEHHVEIVYPKSQQSTLKKLALYTIGRKVTLHEVPTVAGQFYQADDGPEGATRLRGDPRRSLSLIDQGSADRPDRDWLLAWRRADLCQPLPWLDESSSGQHLPQALGLELNDGISYRKGCYPGQEIVARVHYLGRTPDHLLAFVAETGEASSEEPDKPSLHSCTDDQARFNVLDHYLDDKRWVGLAVAPTRIKEGHPIELRGASGRCAGTMASPQTLC